MYEYTIYAIPFTRKRNLKGLKEPTPSNKISLLTLGQHYIRDWRVRNSWTM
jgi:hypothetical protein